MTDSDDLLKRLQQLEVELHDSRARSSERAAQLLAENFVEFGSSGQVYSRAEMLILLASAAPPTISASQFSVQRIAQDAALLTYVSCHHSSRHVLSAQFYLAVSRGAMAHHLSPRHKVRSASSTRLSSNHSFEADGSAAAQLKR